MPVTAARSLAAVGVASAALAAPIALASGDRAGTHALPFRTAVRGEHGPTAIRVGTWVTSATNEIGNQTFGFIVKAHDLRELESTPWQRRFLVGVISTHTTDGYAIAIRRITLQSIGGGRQQLCVVAALDRPTPGRIVLQERTSAYHVVSVPRSVLTSFDVPPAVLRDVSGKLLDKPSASGFGNTVVRPDVCRAG